MSETYRIAERAVAPGADGLWTAAVEHLARRFDGIAPLSRDDVSDRATALPALLTWAGTEISSWRIELARFCDDHARVHLRRDPAVAAALAALRTRGDRLVGVGEGPREASEVVFSFLGLTRRLDGIELEGETPGAGIRIETRDELLALLS